MLRQSERRRLMPTEDLTSDLNSETDFNTNVNTNNSSFSSPAKKHHSNSLGVKSDRGNMKFDFNGHANNTTEDEIKTPDFDADYAFQVKITNKKMQRLCYYLDFICYIIRFYYVWLENDIDNLISLVIVKTGSFLIIAFKANLSYFKIGLCFLLYFELDLFYFFKAFTTIDFLFDLTSTGD